MDLILHVGTEKTGTTSLQSWLAANRVELAQRGFLFPTALGAGRSLHVSMIAADFENSDVIALRQRNISSEEQLREFADVVETRLDEELSSPIAASCHTCIGSDEGCQAVLRNEAEIQRVKAFAERHFSSVKILIGLRPQVDYAVSLASTIARHGFRIDAKWFRKNVTPENHRYNYDRILSMWEHVFGTEAVQVMPYKRMPRAIPAFCSTIGLEPADFKAEPRKNGFMDWRYMHILNSLKPPARELVCGFVSSLPSTERLQIGAALASEITERFANVNAAVTSRRKELRHDDLLPNLDYHSQAPNIHHLEKNLEVGPALDLIFGRLRIAPQ
ncbi:MAG: hypothetical protein Q8J98_11580 [Phaeovulum sp.]|uniref:hypothetical protein n=1 Tax=Phaeovulum sp. TaxID=2934796 RepID=UPI002730766E|nr:hypothetical protein [Phaeovulum sp.]MDP2063729.1 hypothetical protein [Phaeovulum sp.]